MFAAHQYENSPTPSVAVLEIVRDAADQRPQFVPLKRSVVSGDVLGPLASLRLTHVFGFNRAQLDRVVEAVYRFPLPGDAAVRGVYVTFGDVVIHTELKERGQAEADYDQAKREGRPSMLISRETPDVFTLRVAGIAPDEDVTIATESVLHARAAGDGWQLRIPLTTAPRYTRDDEAGTRQADGQPLASLRDPGHRLALDLVLHGVSDVDCSSHELQLTPEGEDGLRASFRGREVMPDSDVVLTWTPRREPRRPALQVWLHNDTTQGGQYFLALATLHRDLDTATAPAREVLLLVDHSGSMAGDKWDAADKACSMLLQGFTERDWFNVCLFHSTTRWLSSQPQPATRSVLEEAQRFIIRHRDSGGTELGVALEETLRMPKRSGEIARHVLIVTDAQVSDESRLVRLVEEEALRDPRRRVNIVCIDSAPNSFLANEIAERGGGSARFLTSAAEAGDLTEALDGVLQEWAQPVVAGLQLVVAGGGVSSPGHKVTAADGASAIDLGDLPAKRGAWIVGHIAGKVSPQRRFSVVDARGMLIARRDGGDIRVGDYPSLPALYGARLMIGLEFLMGGRYDGDALAERLERLGYPRSILSVSPGSPPTVYSETTARAPHQALRSLLVRESLRFGVASSETAFVGVRTEAGRKIEETVAIANALPSGWEEPHMAVQAFAMPASPMRAFNRVQSSPDLFRRPARASADAVIHAASPGSATRGAPIPTPAMYSRPDPIVDTEDWAEDALEVRLQLNQRTVDVRRLVDALGALRRWESQFSGVDMDAVRLLERAERLGRKLAAERLREAEILLSRAGKATTPDTANQLVQEAFRLLDEATLLDPPNVEAAALKKRVENIGR